MSSEVFSRRRTGVPHPSSLVLTFVLLVLSCLAGGLEAQSPRVRRVWGPVVPPEGGAFTALAPRAGGSALALGGGRVFGVDAQGRTTLLGEGNLASLNPAGDSYALLRQERIDVFDGAGAPAGSHRADQPLPLLKLIPGGRLLYAPQVRVVEETPRVERVRILGPGAAPVGDFPAPQIEATRFEADRIVYSQGDQLYARQLDGRPLWQASIAVGKFESAAGRTIAVPRHTRGQVVHLSQGERISMERVDGAVWNLAISPDGETSAVTTPTSLVLFRQGKAVARVRLDLAYANSLSVSDRGEALVGGQDGKAGGHLVLFDPTGRVLWTEAIGLNRGGYRPEVRFAAGGEGFTVLEERGISYYRIERTERGAK